MGDYFDRKYNRLPDDAAKESFLQLLLQVVQSQSLMVSIPVLVSWTRILNRKDIGASNIMAPFIGPLLEVCSSRMIRYESLPENNGDPTFLFLQEDTDTLPERHAFLGNYRRYSSQAIEAIVQLRLVEAVSHILGRTEHILQHLYDGQAQFDSMLTLCFTVMLNNVNSADFSRTIVYETFDAGSHSGLALYSHRGNA